MKNKLDYEVMTPDQSIIKVKRSYASVVGTLIWNKETHRYDFKTDTQADFEELKEVLQAMTTLNKKSILPRWLQWGGW